MTDLAQLFVFELLIKLYGFANFVDQHLVSYECASIGLEEIDFISNIFLKIKWHYSLVL